MGPASLFPQKPSKYLSFKWQEEKAAHTQVEQTVSLLFSSPSFLAQASVPFYFILLFKCAAIWA